MKIWTVNLYVTGIVQPIRLIYKSEERAKNALNHPMGVDGLFTFNDDFGVEIRLEEKPIARVMSDAVEECEANIEMSLLQARAQLKAQQRANNDPTLRNGGSSIVPAGGPVIPFGRPLG